MSSRLGRALRGLSLACLWFLALPVVAQVRSEGAIPDGRGGVGVLATGIGHTCALRQDGTASCWGDNYDGQSRPLPGAFIELSAGFHHTCGLRGDGRVECWGQGYAIPEPPPEGVPPPPPPSPVPAGTYTALASGMSTTCGLRVREQPWQHPEGNVACWAASGWNPLPPPPGGDFVALSLGDNFACGLRANGRVACWGQMDPQQVPGEEAFIAVTAGSFHACALRADGSVRCWGENWANQGTPPAELFTAIGAGVSHTCGLRTDGRAQCWGDNGSNQSTPPPEDRFLALSVGAFHNCGVRLDGTVACWGDVRWTNNHDPSMPPPLRMPWEGVFGVGQLAAGDWHHCQVTPEGRLSCWGGFDPDPAPSARFSAVSSGQNASCARNEIGLLQCFGGNGEVQAGLPFEPLRQFDLGYEHGCGVLALDGRAQCWGRETNGKTLAPTGLFRTQSAGLMHSCGVRADGNGECWGYNGDGQTAVPPLLPERGYLNVEAGERHSCSLDSDLHVKCWGMSPPPYDPNNYDPQYHPDFATFRALSVGAYHSCAIRTDGRLLCWGENWSGQLNVPEGTFVAVSAGHTHTCAIRTEGSRECWGGPLMGPKLVIDPDHLPGARPGEWLSVQFQLRSEPAYPLQDATYAVVAGTLPWGFRLDPNGQLHGSWHETGRFPITVEGRDRNGFAVRRDYVLSIDDTPPVIEPQLTGSAGENGWYTSPVDVQWSVTDPESEIRWSTGCEPNRVENETPDAGFFCHAESVGGPAFNDVHVKVDLMPPHVSLRSFENQGSLARIEFEGHDPMSGVAGYECSLDGAAFTACTTPVHSTFGPGDHELLIRSVDAAGHRSEPIAQRWFVDATSPEVFADITGPQGENDWYVGDVLIRWMLRDGESPITSATGCEPATLSSDALGAGFTCTATSAGGTREQSVTVRRDTVAPETRFLHTPGNAPRSTSALFEFDASDATSGVAGYECSLDGEPYARCASRLTFTVPIGAHSFRVRAYDQAGHRDPTPATHDWIADVTPPEVTSQVNGVLGRDGWYTSDAQVVWTLSDPDSAIVDIVGCNNAQTLTLTTDTAQWGVGCWAASAGGGTYKAVYLKRDATPPETELLSTPAQGGVGNEFSFTGSDAMSGRWRSECSVDGGPFFTCASPYAPGSLAGGSHTFQVRSVDNAGNVDPTPASYAWVVDATPPVVEPVISGMQGSGGWYVGDVRIQWTVADAESAIQSAPGCNESLLTTDTAGAGFTCTATSVGGGTSRTVTVKRDATAPLIVAAAGTAANAAGWYRDAVTIGFTCSDALSGVVACAPAQTLSAEGTSVSGARTISDAAGNSASSNTVTVRIDRTAPTLAPTVPSIVLLNDTAAAAPNGDDGLSGVATESCATLATNTVGNKTVTCMATDHAGNSTTATSGYRVVHGFEGFSAPVRNPSVLNVAKAGRSVPLRWRVVDAAGAPVTNLASASISAIAIGCPAATENRIGSYGNGNGQLQNLGNGYYQLDWAAASSLRGGCRRLELNLGDGQVHPALFKFN